MKMPALLLPIPSIKVRSLPYTTIVFFCIWETLGSCETGERVSAIDIGGWHLGLAKVGEQLSIRIMRRAIDQGVNSMDNSWDYNDGISEERMGKALRDGYREKVFLMTKIDGRSKQES